jgi:hypothetical protein
MHCEDKTCRGCGERKPLAAFSANGRATDGRKYRCKLCYNAERRAWYTRDPSKAKAYAAQYHKEHAAEVSARASRWRNDNRPRKTALQMERQNRQRKATLATVSREALVAIYERSAHLTQLTGVEHHVDHEVPLLGRDVCGLHVPWNLRCIPAALNRSKGNRT